MESARTILVVDDDADIRGALTCFLECLNFHVVSAANGLEALSILEELHPSCILLDMMMPLMNGAEFYRIMLRDPKWRAIPVYLCSATTDEAFNFPLKFSGSLKKPFDLDQIANLLGKIELIRAKGKREIISH